MHPPKNANLAQLYSLKHDFANTWHQFKNADDPENLSIEINRTHFPYFTQGRTIEEANADIWPVGATASSNNVSVDAISAGEFSIVIPAALIDEHDNVFIVINYKLA